MVYSGVENNDFLIAIDPRHSLLSSVRPASQETVFLGNCQQTLSVYLDNDELRYTMRYLRSSEYALVGLTHKKTSNNELNLVVLY